MVPAAPSRKGSVAIGQVCFGRIEDDRAVVSVAEAGTHDVLADAEVAVEELIGRWFEVISLTVAGARMRAPSN